MTLFAIVFASAVFTRSLERVASMDPVQVQSVYDSRVISLVYETPLGVHYEKRPYELVPGACELPSVSGDGLVYSFRMRSGELSAQDVVRSLSRLRDPSLVSPNGWMLKDVASIRAIDAMTVEIVLRARCHYFPWLMAMAPAAIVKSDGSGTGPYRLDSWWKNHEMVFRRRAAGRRDSFDTVRFLVVDDASTQWLMFLNGELDMLGEVSRDNWDAVVGASGRLLPEMSARGVSLYSAPTLESMYIGINMRDPVLGANRKLRQALNAAFDYPAWERFYSGRIVVADGPVPPGVSGRIETEFAYRFDLAKAKRLMVEAGYANGIDPKTSRRLVLTLAIGRASQDSREAGELLASFYERIGIRLELSFHTWEAFLRVVNEGNAQLFRMGWVGDYPDAQNFLQLFYGPNRRPGPNHGDYSNPDYDHAYETALSASDEETRIRQWMKCQEIVREDCPWIFTHYNKANILVGPRVGNYIPSDFPCAQESFLVVKERE